MRCGSNGEFVRNSRVREAMAHGGDQSQDETWTS